MNIKLGPPKLSDLKPRITVIGIGGAGCNAINNMIATELDGVEFVVANTDAQSLNMSNAERRIQLGTNLTEGLGAGARPEVGEAAAREAEEDIRAEIAGSHMVFIAAGMGGGTGTGAATVIAEVARDLGILTVGIVSKPFQFEGARRMRTADAGIEALERVVDTLIVIPNQNLFRIANERTTFAEAFRLADQVLYSGIACIVDLIVKEGLINLDFADVQAVMKGMGTAMMGTGEASGEDRALQAAKEAVANPLLDNVSLSGAQGLLISIVGGSDLTLYEVDTAASHIRKEVAADANIIVGATTEDGMNEKIRVSIVASGLMGSAAAQSPDSGSTTSFGQTSRDVSGDQDAPASVPPPVKQSAASAPPPPPASTGAAWMNELTADELTSVEEVPGSRGDTAPTSLGSELDREGADEFARALSEAMEEAMPEKHSDDEEMGAWQSDDGVVIEEGFGGGAGPTSAPPPLPSHMRTTARQPGSQPESFAPERPLEVRRSSPRMPDVSEFPEVAQREYFAKMEDHDRNRPIQDHAAPPQSPSLRPPGVQPLTPTADREDQTLYGEHTTEQSSGQEAAQGAPRSGLLRRLTGSRR